MYNIWEKLNVELDQHRVTVFLIKMRCLYLSPGNPYSLIIRGNQVVTEENGVIN